MRTIISHFYNEEFLLPWWLEHHKKYFEDGILFDYGSTDKSVEIIKDICPHWTIFPSTFKEHFDAVHCDWEIMWYERQINDWRIAITISEFIIGDIINLTPTISERKQYLIPTLLFADYNPNGKIIPNKPLWEQFNMGKHYKDISTMSWSCRSLHNFKDEFYNPGRHYQNSNTDKLMIFKYNNLFVGPEMIKRKLQVQQKISFFDRFVSGNAGHHIFHNGLSIDNLKEYYDFSIGTTYNCTNLMESVLKFI